ncbi:hypothetical protein KK083_24840 [Fulvivirgaceae bacterium PWU4]|uniref:Golvesin/Xly CBD-like domain-containing protein n=1 Tax=Chryseosolibacter histidini TaxID=2782349 RepID=A0AAP2DT94_9BACT|nr:hypothetical protein [Chryseosolibacter histidini]MBT1700139.1 hypothetical protein [Chryseosolibacter histidini]
MISVSTILTISSYEGKVLWRNWFFRIIALLGIGFVTIFNLAVFSELDNADWRGLSNGWILPYASLLLISIPQAAAVIFLATGLIKKDKKLDTNEVFFVRPITNLDYVLGKALALFKLFFLLNLVLLCVPLIVGLTSPVATVNPMAFIVYPLLTSVPTIVFTTGIAFLLVTVIRNQPITIVLLIGIAGVQVIYYFDKFSNILDFTAFRLSMLASEMTGFVDIGFALWQRTFYFVTGIGFLFLTAFMLDRLSSHKSVHRATLITGCLLLLLSSFIMVRLWDMRQEPIAFRQEMIDTNGRWAEVPNIDIVSHAIALEWAGQEIAGTSELVAKNNTGALLDTIYFTLNPGLTVDSVAVNGRSTEVNRDLQILSLNKGISIGSGEELRVRIHYHGKVVESAAHLEVDQKRYESTNDQLMFALLKKYAFLEDDYVLLTKDVHWYPDTGVGYNRKSAAKERRSFITFELSVKAPAGKVPVSQGEVVMRDNVYKFKPEYPLPHISLVIGNYDKKEITVDSVVYSVYHYPENDFFLRQLDLLGDTLSHLITDVANEYEDAQKLSYPFKRLQFVEVPIHFAAYNKIYESHQALVQPETVFWPEEGGDMRQFDFRRQMKDMSRQAARANQVLTDKQKQANVFNDLIRKIFTKQTGERWVYESNDFDNADYSLFPNYYDFNSGIVSEDWALLNRSIATYLRNDKQVQNDYSREVNGISFTEECNDLMRTASMTKILTEAEFSKINKSVTLKSKYLFSYLGQIIGENNFKSFLYDWVNSHQHQLSSYEDFRKAMLSRFNTDIDPIIRKVYSETAQPAFEILDVQKYEVMDGDRKRYQVLLKAKNSGDSDGVLEVKFNRKKRSDDDNNFNSRPNEEAPEEAPGRLSVIKQGETRLFGFVLDEKPNDLTVNTIISRNIPSVINLSMGTLSRRDGGLLFDGERVVEKETVSNQYEVIVDNEDKGFSSFSPIKPTMLKAYLDRQKDSAQKYYGNWDSSYSRWLATTGSDFYGSVIRSAHFTRSGDGEKIATWTPAFAEEGFYDIYVYMKGKNQNEHVGRDGEGKQFNYDYIVRNGDGTDHIKFNITNAEPGWNYLGSYYFNKTGGSVSLTDACDLRTVYADAVKWVKQ